MDMIDLRSDTVTKPSDEMRSAMANALVGDDVFGDDPTVNELEQYASLISGKEASLFLPTGTMANLVSLLTHCQRGEEYIVGQMAHNYRFEAGGAAVLGSIQPQPIDLNPDGTLPLDRVEAMIKPNDSHYAITKLVSLENTHLGKILPLSYLKQAFEFTRSKQLALHIDGARIFNAMVGLNLTSLTEITQYCDTLTICLSKGLGAPVGSLICGSKQFIERAKRWRKMCGGGMRQAGILAAAGLYALKNNVERLKVDHDNAKWLAEQLSQLEGLEVLETPQTNVLFVKQLPHHAKILSQWMKERGFLISSSYPSTRLITHLNVSRDQLVKLVELWKLFLAENK